MAPGVIWTKEECEALNAYVKRFGKKWTPISNLVGGGKNGKQCRRQWERLNMNTKQGGWSAEEDQQLRELHAIHGNKWTHIARLIGGRTDNAVKNRFHALRTKEKAKLLAGMDSKKLEGLTNTATSQQRCLKHFTSLERLRSELEASRKRETSQQKEESQGSMTKEVLPSFVKGGRTQPVGDSTFVKHEQIHAPGLFPELVGSSEQWPHDLPSYDRRWTDQTSCSGTQQTLFPYTCREAEASTSHLSQENRPFLDISGVPATTAASIFPYDRILEDGESMESSNEDKTNTQLDCASSLFHNDGFQLSFPDTTTYPIASQVLRSCDFDYLYSNQLIHGNGGAAAISPYLTSENQRPTFNTPNLSVDLNFSMFDPIDMEACFQKLSPVSPSAFRNPLSPVVQ